jgi:ribosomal protein S18 acetylase RimI-like enzyme
LDDRERFIIRRFDPERDIDAAYRCYVSGFYHNMWPIIDHAEPRLIKDFMLAFARAADAAFVAEVDGEAGGLLFGYFPARRGSLGRVVRTQVVMHLKVLFCRYRMTPFARAAWWRVATGELAYVVHLEKAPSEVLLLTSEKEHRGGIGRALMDAWVKETESRGYNKIVVSTDSTVSYGFYERYGFQRVRDFPLKCFFYSMPGVDVHGYIYSLHIPPE